MKHYLITNRAVLSDEHGEYVNIDGGEAASEVLRFGLFDSEIYRANKGSRASIELFKDPTPLEKTMPGQQPAPPIYTRADVTDTAKLSGSAKLFAELYKAMTGPDKGDLLFFVHGFHNDLNGSLESVCRLEEMYIKAGSPIKHIVFFSWPAMNKTLRYRDDAKDAELSGLTLARCYLMLIDFFRTLFLRDPNSPPLDPCGNNIHLLAHSMGNRVIEAMMLELYRQKGDNITALFKEVILAASDVDWQIFEEPRAFYSLGSISQRISVYFNTRDLALLISETTKNAYNRLGKFGFRDNHKIPSHVYSVDCSFVKDQKGMENSLVQHGYYKESPLVVRDITQVLKGTNVEDLLENTRTSIPGNAIQYRIKIDKA